MVLFSFVEEKWLCMVEGQDRCSFNNSHSCAVAHSVETSIMFVVFLLVLWVVIENILHLPTELTGFGLCTQRHVAWC